MEKRKLFISYSRDDIEYASKLVDSLRKVGFEVWFDANIRTGDEWDDAIEQEIKNSDAMVLILSKSSVNSNNVKDEMSFAMQLNKGINPIKIEECDVPMRLARKQFTDFTQIEYEQGIHKLVDDIKHKLGGFGKTETPPKPNLDPKTKSRIPWYITGGVLLVLIIIIKSEFFTSKLQSSDSRKVDSNAVTLIDTVSSSEENTVIHVSVTVVINNYIQAVKESENSGKEIEMLLKQMDSITKPEEFYMYPFWQKKSLDYSLLSTVAYFSYEVDPKTGDSITANGWMTAPIVDTIVDNYPDKNILLTVTNFGNKKNKEFLGNARAQDTLIKRVVEMLDTRRAHGVCIAFEGIVRSQRRNYSFFVAALGQELLKHNEDYLVYLTVPRVDDWKESLDFDFLSPIVDEFIFTEVIDSVAQFK